MLNVTTKHISQPQLRQRSCLSYHIITNGFFKDMLFNQQCLLSFFMMIFTFSVNQLEKKNWDKTTSETLLGCEIMSRVFCLRYYHPRVEK